MHCAMNHALKIIELLLSGLGLAFCLWLFYCALQRSESPPKILLKGLLTLLLLAGEFYFVRKMEGSLHEGGIFANAIPALFMTVSVACTGIILSIIWTPHLGELLASPLGNLFDGGNQPPERRPAYSIAQSKRRQKKPLEAIVAIREQLAEFPNDFQGVMLLATIQAVDMEDLPSAEITLNRFCDSPGVPDQEVVRALTQLADWHLSMGSDEDTVLGIMETLMMRFPDAKISRRVAERLGRPKTGEEKQQAMLRVKSEISAQAGDRKYLPNFKTNRRN